MLSPKLQDISGGMNWNMQHADSIRFLAVSGTMVVGDVRASYDFTLVVYRMHIDEVDWTIFSTLDEALANEFTEHFWTIVNFRRKDRRGFLDVSWIDAQEEYEVAPAYREVRLSIFNQMGHTVRVATPFIWRNTYLQMHPNGAAVFAEDKKFAFLLPYIIEAHQLLPSTPIFWHRDDKTIPLCRQTLWLHEDTIKWLAETGAAFPSALHDQITPRISRFKSRHGTKPENATEVPKQMRWRERAPAKVDVQPEPNPPSQEAQSAQPTPQQISDDERRYYELQAAVLNLGYQTMADSQSQGPPLAVSAADRPQSEVKADSMTPAASNTTVPAQATAVGNASTDSTAAQADGQQQATKVPAQALADARPVAPPTPMTSEPTEGTPDTGVLPSGAEDRSTTDEQNKQREARETPSPMVELSVGASPLQSPAKSPDTLASDTVIASSPEPSHHEDYRNMDLETLQEQQFTALETVQELTVKLVQAQSQLVQAQSHAWNIAKRIKTMRENPGGVLPPSETRHSMAMERID